MSDTPITEYVKPDDIIIICDFCGATDEDKDGKPATMIYNHERNSAICGECVGVCVEIVFAVLKQRGLKEPYEQQLQVN